MLERVRIRYTVVLSRFAGRQAGEARTAVDDYRFIDRWRVQGTLDDIWEIMTDGAAFKRWWPGIFLPHPLLDHGPLPRGREDERAAAVPVEPQ
jgi:hypothetical protein